MVVVSTTNRVRTLGSPTTTVTAVYLMVVLTAGAYVPSPLYPGYQQAFGFSDLTLTLIYAVFAVASVPALLVAGPVRDRLGPRPLLHAGVVLAAVGSGCFLAASGPAWLAAGRVAQGLALGAASTLIIDTARPGGQARASLLASLAFVAGTAAGPVAAGLFAQYAPAPFVLPYLAHLALLAYGWARVSRLPRAARTTGRLSRVGVPPGMRTVCATAAAAGFLAWTVAGLFLALIPSLLQHSLHTSNLAVTGAVLGAVLVCSALTQLTLAGWHAHTARNIGTLALSVSLIMLAVGTASGSLPLTLLAALPAGLGHGLAYRGATASIDAAAPEKRRGAVTAVVFVAFYLGSGLPPVVVGIVTLWQPLTVAVIGLAAVAAALGGLTLATALTLHLVSRRTLDGREDASAFCAGTGVAHGASAALTHPVTIRASLGRGQSYCQETTYPVQPPYLIDPVSAPAVSPATRDNAVLCGPAQTIATLADLRAVASDLHTAIARLDHYLQREHIAGRLAAVEGPFTGESADAVATTHLWLTDAATAANRLHDALESAHITAGGLAGA